MPIGIGGMLDGIKTALKSNAKFIWADEKFLTNQKVQAWSDMPVWAGAEDGITRTNISRALSKGLTFRSLDETARDTLAWFKSRPKDRQAHMKAGITPERETEVLAAWKKQKL
jgi:2'-hydroxyisoflavone reductase